MTLVITHSTVTGAAADATALVDGPAWDHSHTLTGVISPAQGGTGIVNNDSSTLTISGSFGTTFTVTATTSLTLPTSGTLATTSNKLSDFAATTSLELKGVISDETGSGALVFANTPTLVTPVLGVATATSVNKVTITAPATSAVLTIPDGVTLTGPAASGTAMTLGNTETVTGVKTFGSAGAVGRLKVAGTTSGTTVLDATAVASGTLTLPAATDTLVGKATTDTFTNKTYDTAGTGNSFSINGVAATANTGTGAVVRAAAPTFSGTVTSGGQLAVTNATAASSTTTGALTVAGGAGIAGDLFAASFNSKGASNGLAVDDRASGAANAWTFYATGGVFAFFSSNGSTNRFTISDSTGAATCLGALLSSGATGGVGYSTGAGGTVTQGAGSGKATATTLSKVSGAITMNNAALAAATIVSFVLTNTAIAATDVLVLNHISGGTIGAYTLNAQCAAGSATINVRNNTAGSLSDAIVIQFAVIKAVNA